MPIKAILFDKDGTLIDVNRTWVPLYRKMLALEFKVDEVRVEYLLAKAGFDTATQNFKPGSPLAGGTTLQLVGLWWPAMTQTERVAKAQFIDNTYAPMARETLTPLMPLRPILEELVNDGYVLGVGTNDSYISASGQVEALGLQDLFRCVLGSDSVATPKPSGLMIEKFAEILGIKTNEIAMIGDNTHDLDEAENGAAGLAVGVLTGNSGRQHMAHLADHIIDSVADLPRLLRSL